MAATPHPDDCLPTATGRVLLLDRDEKSRRQLEVLLREHDCTVAEADSLDAAVRELGARTYQRVFCEAPLLDALLLALVDLETRPPIIVTAANLEAGLRAVDRGAFDCLLTPVEPPQLALALRRASALHGAGAGASARQAPAKPSEKEKKSNKNQELPAMAGMVAKSGAMREVFHAIEKIAQHKTSVLITGESGTGKELVARAIHDLGPRSRKRFVAINCGAIPANLLESELFGYRRGAFTDAVRDKPGLFETADGGTLFLDEIGELPLGLQVKLLRAIQEEEIRRIGDNATIKVDVRIIAATLRDLSRDVGEGRFREDLFYRLNVMPLPLPPLRERREDIPLLVVHFVRKYSTKHGKEVEQVTDEAMELLKGHAWPGNIRELENTIERAMILCDGPILGAHLFEDRLARRIEPVVAAAAAPPADLELDSQDLSIKKATRAIEEKLIRRALAVTGGNRTNASKLLEISHRALLYKIREYGI